MDVSNKTLAMFLVAAVVVSLVGTIISLNKLGTLTTTGYATGTGRVELNVSTTTSIKFVLNTVNWSTGSVNSSGYWNCTLTTVGGHTAGCNGFNTWNESLVIENDGSTILSNVQVNSSAGNTTFPGGTQVYGGPLFMWNFSQNETSSCGSLLGSATWVDVNTSGVGTLVCQGLDFLDANDTIRVGLYVNIPYTATPGLKTATLTATGT